MCGANPNRIDYSPWLTASGTPVKPESRPVDESKLNINKEVKQTGGGIQRINNRKVGGSNARPKVGGSSLNVPGRKLGGL